MQRAQKSRPTAGTVKAANQNIHLHNIPTLTRCQRLHAKAGFKVARPDVLRKRIASLAWLLGSWSLFALLHKYGMAKPDAVVCGLIVAAMPGMWRWMV